MQYFVKDSLKTFGIFVVGASFIILLFMAWLGSSDNVSLFKAFEDMKYQGTMKDGPDQFIVYLDNKGATRWYRVILIDDKVRYISEYPCLIEKGDLVKIRIRWIPNEYANCKRFLKIADNNPEGFCRRYHLPMNKIRTTCRGF